jgi:hypothetical protein
MACVIDLADRIIADIGIKIHLILVPHRIGLHETPERRGVEAGLVVIEAEFGDPGLAGIAEPPLVAGIGEAQAS